MKTQMEKKQMEQALLRRAEVVVPLLAVIMVIGTMLLCSVPTGSVRYGIGCAAAVLGFLGATGVSADTLNRLEKLGWIA